MPFQQWEDLGFRPSADEIVVPLIDRRLDISLLLGDLNHLIDHLSREVRYSKLHQFREWTGVEGLEKA